MAEQRPYRVPGSPSDARLGRVKRIALLSLASSFIAINWVTTQHAASVLRYASWLGRPLFHLKSTVIYTPWSWMVWWSRWYWAPQLKPLWAQSAHEALYPMGVVTAVCCAAIAVAREGWLASASDLHGSARWANTRDLREARLIDPRDSYLRTIAVKLRLSRPLSRRAGIYLGVWRRWHIRDCGRTHVLVFAPTQSGKGRGIVIPTLLTWPHSVIVHDLKGENWALTAGARKCMGQPCLKFEPASPEAGLARFNPLAEVRLRTPYEVRDVQNIVQLLLDPNGAGPPDHWTRAGSEAFEAFILHALYDGCEPTLAGVANLLFDPERKADETVEHLMRAEHDPPGVLGWKDARGNPTRTHRFIAGGMRGLLDLAEKERSSVISEVKDFLRLYRDPVIAANTAVSDFRIDDLVNHRQPLSLYIAVTLADQERVRPLMRLVLAQILNRLTERLEYRDGRAVPVGKRPLLLMLDEFPALGRLDMFATSLSLIAGYGIKACLITQDMKQIYAAYGSNETITSNCDTRVAFRPNGIETARLLSQMTGEATVRHLHQTVSSSGASVSEPEFARLLLTPDEAMRLGASEALIFASGRPVIRAAKFRYYRERLFKRLAMIPPPLVSDHIEHKSEIAEGVQQQKNQTTSQTLEEMEPSQQPDFQFVTVKPRRHKPAPAEQLSFLKFAVKNGKDAVEAPKEEGAKERLL